MPKKSTTKSHKGSTSRGGSTQKSSRAKGSGGASSRQQKTKGTTSSKGNIGNIGDITKKGCLPKLSILALPFLAILVYVLLSA
jgi:uncharacterized protein YceK